MKIGLHRIRNGRGLFLVASIVDLTERHRQGSGGELRPEDGSVRRDVDATVPTSIVVGQSAAIRRVQEQVRQVAETDATVLLLGETGSGKEVFASQIHELSPRRGRAMVRVNCAAIPATLIESELFGREKGAYTGALSRQIGRFELADGSTIFLDEIGDLPLDVQVKLLRVLEDKQIERLGSTRADKVDTRIIAATHRDLEKRIEAGTFREDLYYRLNVFPIRVPPLRERTEDIPHAGVALRRGVLEGVRQAHRVDRQRQHRAAAALCLARQRPRAAQRRGARHDRRQRPASDDRAAASVRRRRATQRRSSPTWRRSTSRVCSTAPRGGFAASAAPPIDWGSKPRRSRRAWRSWGSERQRPVRTQPFVTLPVYLRFATCAFAASRRSCCSVSSGR